MGFNTEKFNNTTMNPRTEDVPVPSMKEFFDEKDEPIWKIKGLDGEAVAKANEAVKYNRDLAALLQGIMSEDTTEKITAIKESIGITDEIPDDLAYRISLLKYGSVEPECNQSMSVRVARNFPVVFYDLTTRILQLTGLGHSLGESNASIATKESE